MKRLFDFVVSAVGLILLVPLFMLVALFVFFEDRGPLFFRQVRVGKGGHLFKIFKFRSMKVQEENHRLLTVGEDERITRVGKWLRKFKIDELPQLINVVVGDMSLVGPRPEVPKYVELYTEEQRRVLEVRPGITDPASIEYRNESEVLARASDPEKFYIEEVMPQKLRINTTYLSRRSLWSDLGIIIKTVTVLFQSKGS